MLTAMQTLFYPLALGVATTALIALSWHYWRDVKRQGATWLVTLLAFWALCEMLRLISADATLNTILLRLSFVSRSLLPAAWVLTTREFAHKPPLSRRRCWLLLLIPFLTQLVLWIPPLRPLFWRDEIAAAQTLWWATPTTLYGPWFWIHTAYSYAVAIPAALPLLEIARRSTQRYREQARFALLGALILGCASAPVVFKGPEPRNDLPAEVLTAGMALLCAWGLYHYQWVGRSRSFDKIYDNIHEATVVLDTSQRVADMNQIACRLLKAPLERTIGESAERIFLPWTLWAPYLASAEAVHAELLMDQEHGAQWLEVHTHPLRDTNGKLTATVVTLQDISQRKWMEQALEARQRELAELNALSRAIASSLALDEVLEGIVNAVMRLFPQAADASVQLLDYAQSPPIRTCSYATKRREDQPVLHFELGQGLAGVAAAEKITLNIPDVLEDPRYLWQKGFPEYRSMLVTPLLFGAEVLGTLSVAASSPHAFGPNDARLLEDLARFASIAVQNANLYEQAQAEIAERQRAVAEMRQNELLYRALFEQTNDAIFFINLKGDRYITANQRATTMLGYTLEELLTHHPNDIILPEEQDDAQARLQHLLAGETVPIYERRFRHKDGRILTAEISIVLIRDAEGAPLHFQSVIRDVTQRKANEEALKQSEEKHRLLLDSIQSPVLALDHEMHILYCNTAYASFVGKPTETLVGRTLSELFPRFAHSRTYNAYQRCLATGKPQTIEGWSEEQYFKARIYPTPWGLLAIADNITEQKRTQDTLQKYAERLQILHEIDRAILEARSPEAIAHSTIQQIRKLIPCERSLIIECDPAGHNTLLALDDDASRLAPAEDVIAIEERSQFAQGQPLAIADLESVTPRLPVLERLYANGVRTCLWEPLLALEQPIGLLCLEATRPHAFQDEDVEIVGEVAASLAVAIRQARLNEQARQDAAIKTTLIDKINHRVKNNLASIIGLIFMAQRHLNPATQELCAPLLERLANQIHVLSTVHQMLSTAEWQMLPLAGLAEQVVRASLQVVGPQARIGVTVTPSPLKADSKQANSLALILHELTTNTVKHGVGERGVARITIHIETETPGPWGTAEGVRLEFRDDGPGYAERVLESNDWHMGLYLVQRLVAINLRGVVTFHNDHGAVACLRFPISDQNSLFIPE